MRNKTAIITGAGRGIGEQIAKVFARNNYRVVITYINDSYNASRVKEDIQNEGQEVSVFRYDSASPEAAKDLVEFTLNRYGRIDTLVNNAGISFSKTITETSNSDWYRVINANLSGVFFLSREVITHMISNNEGSIVNISSIYGIIGASTETAYSVSKAGIIGLSKALAKELAPCNITVNCIAPGVIDTKMNEFLNKEERKDLTTQIPLGRFGTAKEVAEAAYFLSEHKYITGQILCVDGGIT